MCSNIGHFTLVVCLYHIHATYVHEQIRGQRAHGLPVDFSPCNRVLRWFFSYLADYFQTVVDAGGNISDWLSVASGVPQGSVRGPLLFSIYVNDLPSAIRCVKVRIFADNTQLYLHFLPALPGRRLGQSEWPAPKSGQN